MRTLVLITLLIPSILFAQYWGERTTEQSFEESELYFQSHFLNTFGLKDFKQVAVGLVDDPFLNLQLNPANLPGLREGKTYVYLDFRGDRTSAPVIDHFVFPNYYITDRYYRPYVDPRWLSTSRSEPEPTFSIGVLTYPIEDIAKNFFFGGTYQIIHRDEKFYTIPYWIYNSRYLYDSFGLKAEGLADVPIKDRFSGRDEMMTDGHLFSIFAGYKFWDKLKAGVSLNGVIHSRDGGYLNSSSDEFGNTDKTDWENSQEQSRIQDYNHLDLNAGIIYEVLPSFEIGIKGGILTGDADQEYKSLNYNYYKYNTPNVSQEWSYNFSRSSTLQNWRHDGVAKYIGFNFKSRLKRDKEFSGYYRYSNGSVDFSNTSVIVDTSIYTSRWVYNYDNSVNDYHGNSLTSDLRHGSGSRKKINHEVMLNFKWQLTSASTIRLGVYMNNFENKIKGLEPVLVKRESEYHHNSSSGNYNYDNYYLLLEDKNLEWDYSSKYWTVQIPILLYFKLNENFGLMFGVNRILKDWEINDKTTAYFKYRETNENGENNKEVNFGERYTQPAQNITENSTDVIFKIDAAVSSSFKINLLIDPEFENIFRVAQWWLSFEADF